MNDQDDNRRMERIEALEDDEKGLDRGWRDRYVEYQLGELKEEDRISPHAGEDARARLARAERIAERSDLRHLPDFIERLERGTDSDLGEDIRLHPQGARAMAREQRKGRRSIAAALWTIAALLTILVVLIA